MPLIVRKCYLIELIHFLTTASSEGYLTTDIFNPHLYLIGKYFNHKLLFKAS